MKFPGWFDLLSQCRDIVVRHDSSIQGIDSLPGEGYSMASLAMAFNSCPGFRSMFLCKHSHRLIFDAFTS